MAPLYAWRSGEGNGSGCLRRLLYFFTHTVRSCVSLPQPIKKIDVLRQGIKPTLCDDVVALDISVMISCLSGIQYTTVQWLVNVQSDLERRRPGEFIKFSGLANHVH